jgi:hypothetical protein
VTLICRIGAWVFDHLAEGSPPGTCPVVVAHACITGLSLQYVPLFCLFFNTSVLAVRVRTLYHCSCSTSGIHQCSQRCNENTGALSRLFAEQQTLQTRLALWVCLKGWHLRSSD